LVKPQEETLRQITVSEASLKKIHVVLDEYFVAFNSAAELLFGMVTKGTHCFKIQA
jgi:hypothetical protein